MGKFINAQRLDVYKRQAIAIEYQTLLKMTAVIGFVFEPRKLNAAELEIYQAWLEDVYKRQG